MRVVIRRPLEAELAEIISFAALHNGRADNRCLHLDSLEKGIAAEIADLDTPFTEVFWIAEINGQLVGLLGVDLDEEGECAWLLGPWSNSGPEVLECLLDHAHSHLPLWVKKVRQFLDERNKEALALHQKHWYLREGVNEQYEIDKASALWQREDYATALCEKDVDGFRSLHEMAFPDTWLTAEAIVAQSEDKMAVFITREGEKVTGYICLSIHPSGQEGTVEYIAVSPVYRGMGLGYKLLQTGLKYLFANKNVQRAQLVVEEENRGPQRLYRKCGFDLHTVGLALNCYRLMAAGLETEWQVHSAGAKKFFKDEFRYAAACEWAQQKPSHFMYSFDKILDLKKMRELRCCEHGFSMNDYTKEPRQGRNDICLMVCDLTETKDEPSLLELVPLKTDEHFEQMVQLRREVERFYPSYEEDSEVGMVDYIRFKQQHLKGSWFLAKRGKLVVGGVGVILVDTDIGTVGRLQDVDVHPAHRGGGLGNELLKAIFAHCKKVELTYLFLRAEYDDWPRKWYGRYGFKELAYCRRKYVSAR